MKRPRLRLGSVVLLLAACNSGRGGTHGSPADTGSAAPTARPTHNPGDRKPIVGVQRLLEGPRPAIRNATALAKVDGHEAVAVRLLLSKVTAEDGLRVALRFSAAALAKTDAGSLTYDWGATLAALRFTVRGDDGASEELALAAPPKPVPLPEGFVHTLVLDATGVTQEGERSTWTKGAAFLSKPQRYTLLLTGNVVDTQGGKVAVAAEPLAFEVVAATDKFLSIDALVKVAVLAVGKHVEVAAHPMVAQLAVDDAVDHRWLRFAGKSEQSMTSRYIDARLSPSGELVALQQHESFLCVARGTPVATPRGDRSVELLAPGDEVLSWDPSTQRGTTSRVLATRASMRDGLVVVGGARMTPEHPVFVDGRFVPAGEVRAGELLLSAGGAPVAAVVGLDARAEVVFDLSVDDPHTFFAGGVLVHNKAVPTRPHPSERWMGLFRRETDVPGAP